MKKVGMMIVCDRCGESVFLNKVEPNVTDGGYTKTDIYEQKPDDWGRDVERSRDLCPSCFGYYKEITDDFYNTDYRKLREDKSE